MNPYIYLLNGGPTLYFPSGNITVNNLTVLGSETVAGNLTVSGGTITGGSSGLTLAAAGANQNVTLTPSGSGINVLTGKTAAGALNSGSVPSFDAATVLRTSGNITIDGSGRNANGAVAGITSAMADAAAIQNFVGTVITSYSNAANWVGATFFSTKNGAASSSEVARFAGNGNFLLGTTTDSSNGRLQLATHTTSAGGIGFGTDVSLYRNGANSLYSSGHVQTGGNFYTNYGLVVPDGSRGVDLGTANTLYLRTGGLTGLTIDSSQRTVLSGALRLNNAYVAGAIVSTGYVTLQDSTGTTYKVAVSL